jgi:hypothetical protein
VVGDYVSSQASLRYKYIVEVDGYGATLRHKNSMLGGFLIFKVDSEHTQFYFATLKPWVHFVPVDRHNLADSLAARVRWARAHDAESRAIAERSAQFARRYLTFEAMHAYQAEVLRQFADKLAFAPFVEEDAHEFCCSQLAEEPELAPHCVETRECGEARTYPVFELSERVA